MRDIVPNDDPVRSCPIQPLKVDVEPYHFLLEEGMMRSALLLVLMTSILAACAPIPAVTARGTRPTAAGGVHLSDEECKALWNRKRTVTVWSAVLAALSGGSGISTVIPDDQRTRLVPGLASLAIGGTSAGLAAWAKALVDDFDRFCEVK